MIILELIKNFIELIYTLRWLLLILFLINLFREIPYIIMYYKSNYRKESGVSLLRFLIDTGYFGEGLTFIKLEKIPVYSKILTNLYIPTEDGTTEIDLVYITTSGIYVIESKNYSGWIYGSYNQKDWLSNIYGKKYKFYNPLWQNHKHIKYLEKLIPNNKIYSLIVFSERSEFKKLNVDRKVVIQRQELKERILISEHVKELTIDEIDTIYNKLKQYGKKTNVEKKEHIEKLKIKK